MQPTLKNLIAGNYCSFDSVRAGFLYYTIDFINEEETMSTTYRFTVPIEDIGGATLNAREKAITMMRWIRKAYDAKELIFVRQHRLQQG